MIFQSESTSGRDLLLPLFDRGIVKFFHMTAGHTDQMVVMAAFTKFKNRFARFEVITRQQSGLLKLGQHSVDRSQTNILAFFNEHPIDVLRTEVPAFTALKNLENRPPRPSYLEAETFQFIRTVHSAPQSLAAAPRVYSPKTARASIQPGPARECVS